MNNLKRVLLFFGVVVLVITVALLAKNVIDINQLAATASGSRAASVFNPGREVLLTAALALLTGLLLGVGFTLHTRPERPRPAASPPEGPPLPQHHGDRP